MPRGKKITTVWLSDATVIDIENIIKSDTRYGNTSDVIRAALEDFIKNKELTQRPKTTYHVINM